MAMMILSMPAFLDISMLPPEASSWKPLGNTGTHRALPVSHISADRHFGESALPEQVYIYVSFVLS